MISTIKSEWLYWVAFILVLVFIGFERPNKLFLDLNILFLNSISAAVPSSNSPESALSSIIGVQSTLLEMIKASLSGAAAFSTLQPIAPLLVASISSTSHCTSSFSGNLPSLWSSSNILSSMSASDTLSGWNSSISCMGGTFPSLDFSTTGTSCDASVSKLGSSAIVAALPNCNVSAILGDWSSSALSSAELRFLLYSTGGETIFIGKVLYTLHPSGTFWLSTSSYALHSMILSSSFVSWVTLVSLSLMICFALVYVDARELYLVATFKGTRDVWRMSYKFLSSFFLTTLPISRLILYYSYMNQFDLLSNFYGTREFTARAVYSLYIRIEQVVSVYSGFNVFCFVVILLSTLRFLDLPQSHPRIAMLSSTVLIGQVQLSNFMILSGVVILVYGLLGSVLLSTSANPQYMSFFTLGLSEVTLSSILVGVWPFGGTIDSYAGFLLISFLVIYGIFAMFLLVNVFLVIIVDNFMKFKVDVEEQVVENNFFYDLWLLLELCVQKLGLSGNSWPKSESVAAVLQYLRDKKVVDGDIVERDMFLQYMSWMEQLNSEDIALIKADTDLQVSTVSLIMDIWKETRGNRKKTSPEHAWKWYSDKFAATVDDFLHSEFSLAAHRYGLRCKYIVRDLDSVRTVINGNITRSHEVFKDLGKSRQRLVQNCQTHASAKSLQVESQAALWHLAISDIKTPQFCPEQDDLYMHKLLNIVKQQNDLLKTKINN